MNVVRKPDVTVEHVSFCLCIYSRVTASKVNNPIKDTTEKPDVAQDTSAHFGVDPDEVQYNVSNIFGLAYYKYIRK